MQLGEKLCGIGKEELVPGVTAPAERLARLVLFSARFELLPVDMPVHVNDEYVQRRVVLVEAAHDVLNLLVAVGPVARPPRAKGEAGRQRDAAGNAHIIAQRLLVVMSITEEVEVLPRPGGPLDHPWPGALLALSEAEVGR